MRMFNIADFWGAALTKKMELVDAMTQEHYIMVLNLWSDALFDLRWAVRGGRKNYIESY